MSKQLTPLGEGYCPLETAYGHGGPTEYCKNESHPKDDWCTEHLDEWGYSPAGRKEATL